MMNGNTPPKDVSILMVEDEPAAAEFLLKYLETCGFAVEHRETTTDALAALSRQRFDLVLLDLVLPDFSGFDLLRELRTRYTTPVIIISAHGDTKTKVRAFRHGASDYMVKPIDPEELEARIWAVLGRHSALQTTTENEVFRIQNNQIFFNGKVVDLTATEFDILSLLIRHRNTTLTREYLADTLSSISSHRSLDHHIKNIRKKLGEDSKHPRYLKTEYGVGYKLVY
jgi:DNA-binding response OmpR family regulator